MSEPPFHHLSEVKFQEVLGLARVVKAEYDAAGKVDWSLEEAAKYSISNTKMALNAMVEKLTFQERAELVAIMQIGRGVEIYNRKNWGEIYNRAILNSEHASFVTTIGASLSGYLEKGFQIVKRP